MIDSAPHYLLTAETARNERYGTWKFVLRPSNGARPIEVADVEPNVWGERLDLLTVVRALESLDQPSAVTVVSCTRYVQQGIQYGIGEWRENGWRWEWFGQMVPVRDADLWQRLDQALQFHRVECGTRRFDESHDSVSGPHGDEDGAGHDWTDRVVGREWIESNSPAVMEWCGAQLEKLSLFFRKLLGHRQELAARGC